MVMVIKAPSPLFHEEPGKHCACANDELTVRRKFNRSTGMSSFAGQAVGSVMRWPSFSRRQICEDLADEIQQHLEERADALAEDGILRAEALQKARREFGNLTQIEERGREAWQWPNLESVLADLKYGLRQLRRSPGFALSAILTLALGIAANTAIFTLVDSIMLRPLRYPNQQQLARIPADPGGSPKGRIRELARHSQTFASISGYGPNAESTVTQLGAPERVFGSAVMVNAFDVLGIHPAVGRFFSPEDGVSGQDFVVVLSYGYWRQHFAGDPAALGETVRINGISRRIVGVVPPGVHFPYADTQFVILIAFVGADPIDPWRDFSLRAFGRLKERVSPRMAQAELLTLRPRLLALFPWRMPDVWGTDTTVVPLLDAIVGDMRPRLLLLSASAGLILLIACANVANLMLAKAVSREREIAIRGALGASPRRIVRQLLTESLLLGIMAGVAGLLVACASLRLSSRLLPPDTPRLADIGLHRDVFLFALGASIR